MTEASSTHHQSVSTSANISRDHAGGALTIALSARLDIKTNKLIDSAMDGVVSFTGVMRTPQPGAVSAVAAPVLPATPPVVAAGRRSDRCPAVGRKSGCKY